MKYLGFSTWGLFLMCVSSPLAAHGPGCSCCHHGDTIAAPHGGMVDHAHNTGLVVELLANDGNFQVYVFEHDLQPAPKQEFSLNATLELSRRHGGAQEIPLTFKNGAFVGSVEIPERAFYYKVRLNLEHEGQSDEVVFTIEL